MSDHSVIPVRGELVGANQRQHLVGAGAVGVVLGWLLGRRHQPLVWTALVGTLFAVAALLIALLPYVLAAGALLLGEHLVRRRGWSIRAAVIGVLSLALALAIVVLVAVGIDLGVGLVVGVGLLVGWRSWGRRQIARW